MSQKSIYSDAQWEWCAEKFRKGYTIHDISVFLGLHRESVARKFQRMGVLVKSKAELQPLDEFSAEFNALQEANDE